ncbi:MAG: ATP-binding protein [Promethearchaeota archaeon]
MVEKVDKNKKSVSKLLDTGFGKVKLYNEGIRGKVLHETWRGFYEDIFKTANRGDKVNYRVFSQKVTKIKTDQLSNIGKNKDFALYYEDAKVLLNCLQKKLLYVAKALAKLNYQIVIPESIEKELFGGCAFFESDATEKIGGIKINARVDCLIELGSDSFIVRDFKSYELEKENDPINPESEYHRNFMQICLYAIIYEKERRKRCVSIQIAYFPNQIVSYDFTKELKEAAIKFAIDTAFEGFEGISFDLKTQATDEIGVAAAGATISPDLPDLNSGFDEEFIDDDSIGWINTLKGKPLEIIRGKDNKLFGYLFPNKAELVKEGALLIVEKEDGIRIIGPMEKIECSEDHVSGETKSHTEENYKILINPEKEFTPEGIKDVRPQTIIRGKIKFPTHREIYEYWGIPQTGIPLGVIDGLDESHLYYYEPYLYYQSLFIGGVQESGKTNALKYQILKLAHIENPPSQIILDHEDEYRDLRNIATTEESANLMEKHGIKAINPHNFNVLTIGPRDEYCLTLKAIDPLNLPYFLRELTPITYASLQTIIYDIMEDHKDREFTLPELKCLILSYMDDDEEYDLAIPTKKAIRRALTSISLKIFDISGTRPLKIDSLLRPGAITIINTYNLRDYHQRIVGLYLCAMLHKRALKGKYRNGVLLIMDEIQRILPKSKSKLDAEYQKRIIGFLDNVVHRGRKRNYGVAFATQSPLDVKKEIIDLCNTKLFFQIHGDTANLLKEYLTKEKRDRLKKLQTGEAYIISKKKHAPVVIKFPKIE